MPTGTALTGSGSIVAGTAGETISGRSVAGSITVTADNVTIVDTQVLPTVGGNGTAGIVIQSGADGTVIQNTTVSGPGSGSQTLEAAIRNSGGGTVAERVDLTNCSDCWEGEGEIRDSYMRIDSIFPGAHAEDIYVCSGSIVVNHSTLLNAEEQTATVFGDTICGGGNSFTVTNSLLAGGGYVLYPQANSGGRTGTMRVTGNRIGRCTGAPAYDSRSGGTGCASGADEGGFWPHGGYFGVAAAYYTNDPQDVWEGNVWADSSRSLCPDGSSGCPALTPSSEPPPLIPTSPFPGTGPVPAVPPASVTPTGTPAGSAAGTKGRKGQKSGPHAILRLPATIKVGALVKLAGRFPGGVAPFSCRWVIKRASSGHVVTRRRGCRSAVRFGRAGTDYVVLTIHDSRGHKLRQRRKVDIVRPG